MATISTAVLVTADTKVAKDAIKAAGGVWVTNLCEFIALSPSASQ